MKLNKKITPKRLRKLGFEKSDASVFYSVKINDCEYYYDTSDGEIDSNSCHHQRSETVKTVGEIIAYFKKWEEVDITPKKKGEITEEFLAEEGYSKQTPFSVLHGKIINNKITICFYIKENVVLEYLVKNLETGFNCKCITGKTIKTKKHFKQFEKELIKKYATKEEYSTEGLPSSWEGLGEIKGEYIVSDSFVLEMRSGHETKKDNKNITPKGLAQPILSLIQLLQLRDRYRQGWKPSEGQTEIFTFPTKEIEELFYKNFSDLLNDYAKLME